MHIDFSGQWRIIGPSASEPGGPAAFAAQELAAAVHGMGGLPPIIEGSSVGSGERIFVLDAGREAGARRFSWRAAEDRVEIYGESGAALLRGAYDFLSALGIRPRGPGAAAPPYPSGPLVPLELGSRAWADEAIPATLALSHGAFLERYADYLPWAVRVGYGSVLVRITSEPLALEAAPESLYESLRAEIAALARKLGLALELEGELGGNDFSPEAFAAYASAHPEVSVFHPRPAASPDENTAEMLHRYRAFASALSKVRPEARLSFPADEDSEGLAAAVRQGGALPPGLELLWEPRRRTWGRGIGDPASAENAASLRAFEEAALAWRSAGGGRVVVLEPYEDAYRFRGAVPPLASVIETDLEAYRRIGVGAAAIVCGGGRLPLAPRPNLALFPLLAASPRAEAALAEWAGSATVLEYWRELETAWAIDLSADTDEADLEILAAKRARCEELFDHLRRAEVLLTESGDSDEAAEYSISGSILELNCAKLAALHELAAGDARAAADVANLALSAAGAVRKALKRLEDPRARREIGLLIGLSCEARLREIRRANARSGIRRLIDLWYTRARAARAAASAARAYEPAGARSEGRGLARREPRL